jgi:hypothetical protein
MVPLLDGSVRNCFRCELHEQMLLKPPLPPMEARLVDEIPTGNG